MRELTLDISELIAATCLRSFWISEMARRFSSSKLFLSPATGQYLSFAILTL